MIHRKRFGAPAALLAGVLAGSIFIATEATAAPGAKPAANTCFVDVVPSAGDQPMWLDVNIRCAVTGVLSIRANSRQSASFIAKFTNAVGEEIKGDGRLWKLPANPSGITEAHYRFELDAFLNETNSEEVGMRRGLTRALLLEGWLAQPIANDDILPLSIAVNLPTGQNFASGMRRIDGRYILDDTPVRFAGYSVFGQFKPMVVPVPPPPSRLDSDKNNAHVDLVILEGDYVAAPQQYADWVGKTAQAIATYFDGFSSMSTLIIVFPARGSNIQFGRVVPGGGVTMILRAGTGEKPRDLFGEWVLVHEMIHTAAPFVDGRGSWLMEGMATYIEPIIRSRVGWKTEDDVWHEWLVNMPRGVSSLSEVGLLNDSSRNAYYWGGGLFMLLTDVEMRRATANKYGLEDCLRAILKGGGNAATRVTVEQFISTCDRAAGGTTMADLAKRYVYKATPFDLNALWRDLGVELVGGNIVYRDDAPLASVRKAIVRGMRSPTLVPIGPA